MTGTTSSPTEQLAVFTAGLGASQMTPRSREVAGQCMLDFVAVALGGARVSSTAPVLAAARSIDGLTGSSTVIGRAEGASADTAALLNGLFAHSLDFDDTNIPSALHPGAPVIPALLAAAELVDADGTDVLAGLLAGYEVTCRIGRALGETTYDRGFHPTAIAGTFGAAAAASRVLGLDSSATVSAFGVAGSTASGSMQFLENGAWNKRLHAGLAARGGLWAALLAREGFVGSARALEGRAGALKSFSDRPDPAALTESLGKTWLMEQTGFKPYPSCRLTHAATDLALDLRARLGRPPVDGETITVVISPRADSIVGGSYEQKVRPRSEVDGQFSVRFQCAIALLDGAVDWASYGRLGDPDVDALSTRLNILVDPDLPSAAATLRLSDGTSFDKHRSVPRGECDDPDNPLLVENKLRRVAAGTWDDPIVDRLVRWASDLSTLPPATQWVPTLAATRQEASI